MARRKKKNTGKLKFFAFVLVIILIAVLVAYNKNNSESNSTANSNTSVSNEVNNSVVIDKTEEKKVNWKDTVNEKTASQLIAERGELEDGLPVLMYHFFYDDETYWKQDNNWLKVTDFEEQLKYMREENFYFPTWDEVEDFIDGKIKLPAKSVVLTVDDGDDSFFDLAVPLLKKYKIPATSFVICEWYGWKYNENLEYVNWESHSYSMHEGGANGKGKMVNWDKDSIVEDLNKSTASLGGKATVYCYPFGHYNDTAIEALKEAKYRMAFTIEGGRVEKGDNKYLLTRVRVSDGNSLSYFKGCIN